MSPDRVVSGRETEVVMSICRDIRRISPLSFALMIVARLVRFGAGGAEPTRGMDRLDINGDGRLDLLLHCRTQELGIACGDTSVSLTGSTYGGQAFKESDSIVTVGCR